MEARMEKERYGMEGVGRRELISRAAFASSEGMEAAYQSGAILEGRVTLCDSSLTLHVDCGCMKGIIKREDAVYSEGGESVKDIAIISRVGKTVCFKVIGFVKDRYGERRALLSRRLAQEECLNERLMRLRAGDVIEARITHLEHFGAFCDIGCGIVSMIPIDCISVSRISHPSDRFTVGDRIRAVVAGHTDDGKGRKVCLSHKELLGTWEENAACFESGQTVSGIVRSVEPYGIFVELSPNLAGLADLRPRVRIGDVAAVYIKSILPERMKIKLVIVDTYPNEGKRLKPVYYVPESVTHLEQWVYSPPSCPRYSGRCFGK